MVLVCISFEDIFFGENSGKIFPSGIAADSYKKAVDSAMEKLKKEEVNNHDADLLKLSEPPS